MCEPTVSVLMAVRNGELHLREAVDSILKQSFDDFEFIIIDDRSNDSSYDMLKSYEDPRLRLIRNRERLGLTRSLNGGLRIARGHFIARQDADDISEPTRLAQQVRHLREHPELALVGSQYIEIDEGGLATGRPLLPTESAELRWALLFVNPFAHSAVMFRRMVVDQIGLYNEAFAYAQDHELWIRIAQRFAVANLSSRLLRYRLHARSVTSMRGADVLSPLQLRLGCEHLGRLLEWDEPLSHQHQQQFERMYALLYGVPRNLSVEEVGRTSEDVVLLFRSFCERYGLSGTARKRLSSRLRCRLSHGCLRAAIHLRRSGRPERVGGLLRRALEQHPAAILTVKGQRLVFRLLSSHLGLTLDDAR